MAVLLYFVTSLDPHAAGGTFNHKQPRLEGGTNSSTYQQELVSDVRMTLL